MRLRYMYSMPKTPKRVVKFNSLLWPYGPSVMATK